MTNSVPYRRTLISLPKAQLDVRNTYTNTKRAALARQTIPQNVIIGIILAVIAVIACVIVAFLLWRLNRQARVERRLAQRVDLLSPEPVHSPPNSNGMSIDMQNLASGHWSGRPLPQIPRGASVRSSLDLPRSSSHVSHRGSIAASPYGYSLVSDVPVIRPLLPAVSRQETTRELPPNVTISHNSSNAHSSMTRPHTRIQSGPSVDDVISHSRFISNHPLSSESSGFSDILPGQLTAVGVFESDNHHFQRSQRLHRDLPPPDYTGWGVRGRDAPFPSKEPRKLRPPRPPPIITALHKQAPDDIPSTASPSSWDKRGFGDMPTTPETAYTVHVPIVQSVTPGSPLASQHTRPPLTITTSRPMSNVTLEDMGSIRRPDGTKGKGRKVTMTVLVEDSDDEAQDALRVSPQQSDRGQRETQGEDVISELVERYAADLPPYTPVHEFCTVP